VKKTNYFKTNALKLTDYIITWLHSLIIPPQ